MTLPFKLVALSLLGVVLFAAGFLSGRAASSNGPGVNEEAEDRMESSLTGDGAYPTEIRQTSNTESLLLSPYVEGLIKVRCRGTVDDPKASFFAVFKCKENNQAKETAFLERGMRLKLDMIPFDEAPEGIHKMAMADDVDDLRKPVYFVKSYEHDDHRLNVAKDPARKLLAAKAPFTILRGQYMVPAGHEQRYMYMFGGDWHIYKPGVEELLDNPVKGNIRSSIRHFNEYLNQHGTKLLVAPVPQSASLYPDVLLGVYEGQQLKMAPPNRSVMESLFSALKEDGVGYLDLTSLFTQNRIYHREGMQYTAWMVNDTHWSSWATSEAAAAMAKLIHGMNHKFKPAAVDSSAFEVQWKKGVYGGDIMYLEPLKDLGINVPESEMYRLHVTGKTPEAQTLLETNNPESEVHVIGDSFAAIFESERAGFRAHLIKELGREVFDIANMAGGKHAPHVWLQRNKGHFPKTLIWLFTERCMAESEWAEITEERVSVESQ